jgi:hypothetical protein
MSVGLNIFGYTMMSYLSRHNCSVI